MKLIFAGFYLFCLIALCAFLLCCVHVGYDSEYSIVFILGGLLVCVMMLAAINSMLNDSLSLQNRPRKEDDSNRRERR